MSARVFVVSIYVGATIIALFVAKFPDVVGLNDGVFWTGLSVILIASLVGIVLPFREQGLSRIEKTGLVICSACLLPFFGSAMWMILSADPDLP